MYCTLYGCFWTDLIYSVLCLNRPPQSGLVLVCASFSSSPALGLLVSRALSLSLHLRRSVSISPSLSLTLSSRYTQNSGPFFPYPPSTVSYRIVLLLAVLTGATWLRTGHHLVSARLLPTIFYITSTFHYYLSWLLLPLLPNKHMY